MTSVSPDVRRSSKFFAVLATALALFSLTSLASSQIALVKLSTDTFTNSSSQHATEVEPDTFAFGNTIVSAFQVGRIFGGGSSDIGFATSTDGGTTWTNGFLPGITTFFSGGPFSAASDASVAFDSAHGKWLVASLGLSANNSVLASSSNDGITWNNPVTVDNKSSFADKDWIACDNNPASPFFGHCYIEWDDAGLGDQEKMSTSTDGGQTWSKGINITNAFGLGGQPVVQTNGTVVVPFEGNGIQAFSSTNGGTSWGNVVTVSTINDHGVAGSLRTSPLPSADVDNIGTVYVAWQDCRFRTNCSRERHRLQYFHRRQDLEQGLAHPHRRHYQHGRPFHPWLRGRSHYRRQHGAPGIDLLLLSRRQLFDRNLQAGCGIHFVPKRRRLVGGADPPRRSHAPQLAAQYFVRPDGRGLYFYLVHHRRLRRVRQSQQEKRSDFRLCHVYEHDRTRSPQRGPVQFGERSAGAERPL